MKSNIYLKEKGPYLLTLLFAALAWTINQVSEDISSAPTIEVMKASSLEDGPAVVYTITNISKNSVFKDLLFAVHLDGKTPAKCVQRPRLKAFPPVKIWSDDPTKIERPICKSDLVAEYKVEQLQPGGRVQLIMKVSQLSGTELYVKSDSAIRVKETSLETLLLKYKFQMLVSLVVIWGLAIFYYIICLIKGDTNEA